MAARLNYSATARCATHGLLLARASGCPLCASEAAAFSPTPKRVVLGLSLIGSALVILWIGFARRPSAVEPAGARIAERPGAASQPLRNDKPRSAEAMIAWARASLSTNTIRAEDDAASRHAEHGATVTPIEDRQLGQSWQPSRQVAAITRPPDPPRASVDPEPESETDVE